jgi:uncharacterized membrane protein
MSEANELLDYGKPDAKVNMGGWISKAWELTFSDLGYFVVLALIYIAIIAVASATIVGEFIVIGPLSVGLFYIAFRKIQGKPFQIGDIAKGFSFFAAAVISNILISIFASIGFALCIIPGIIVSALYMFTPAFILDKKLDFWNAMEASRKVVQKHIFELTIFIIVLGIINFIGVIVCIVGVFVTFPITIIAVAIAYDELVGIEPETE